MAKVIFRISESAICSKVTATAGEFYPKALRYFNTRFRKGNFRHLLELLPPVLVFIIIIIIIIMLSGKVGYKEPG